MGDSIVLNNSRNTVQLNDGFTNFGQVEELTSAQVGAEKANVSRVTLWGPDHIHAHIEGEETYICVEGNGELLLGEKVFNFFPGIRAIIKPRTLHAARPTRDSGELVFWCVSSPPFDFMDISEEHDRWHYEE